MGRRRIRQASLAEALLPPGAGSNGRLERIAGLIDWAPMERLPAPLRAAATILRFLGGVPGGFGAADITVIA